MHSRSSRDGAPASLLVIVFVKSVTSRKRGLTGPARLDQSARSNSLGLTGRHGSPAPRYHPWRLHCALVKHLPPRGLRRAAERFQRQGLMPVRRGRQMLIRRWNRGYLPRRRVLAATRINCDGQAGACGHHGPGRTRGPGTSASWRSSAPPSGSLRKDPTFRGTVPGSCHRPCADGA